MIHNNRRHQWHGESIHKKPRLNQYAFSSSKGTRPSADRFEDINLQQQPASPRRPIPPGCPSASFPYLASQFETPPRGIPFYKPLSTTPLTQYSLKNTATTIRTLLLEWIAGLPGHLSIQELNRDLGTLWRVRGERNLYNSRATIVREFRRLVEEGLMSEEEAITHLQLQLGKNAFLTLSKRIGQENKTLGRYQEESMTPRAVASRKKSSRQGRTRMGAVKEEQGEDEEGNEEEGNEEEGNEEAEKEEQDETDTFDGPEQHKEHDSTRGNTTNAMRYTQEQNAARSIVASDQSNGWREVKEEEPALVKPHSWYTRESRDEQPKSKKRQRPGPSREKKVAFDDTVRVKAEGV